MTHTVSTLFGVIQLIVAIGCCGRRSTEPPPSPPPPGAVLPDSAFNVRWDLVKAPPRFRAIHSDTVIVRVRNESDVTWPDRAMADPSGDGRRAVRLAHRWIGPGASDQPPFGAARTELSAPLPAGESVEIAVPVIVPALRGSYILQFALVQENIAWFTDKGGMSLDVPVQVD